MYTEKRKEIIKQAVPQSRTPLVSNKDNPRQIIRENYSATHFDNGKKIKGLEQNRQAHTFLRHIL